MIIHEIYIPNRKLRVKANIKFINKSDIISEFKMVKVNIIFKDFKLIFKYPKISIYNLSKDAFTNSISSRESTTKI